MGEIVSMQPQRQLRGRSHREKRRLSRKDYVRGQQILADAIFHWKNDPSEEARACVRVLMNHLATRFRADDEPLQPRPIETVRAADGEQEPTG